MPNYQNAGHGPRVIRWPDREGRNLEVDDVVVIHIREALAETRLEDLQDDGLRQLLALDMTFATVRLRGQWAPDQSVPAVQLTSHKITQLLHFVGLTSWPGLSLPSEFVQKFAGSDGNIAVYGKARQPKSQRGNRATGARPQGRNPAAD